MISRLLSVLFFYCAVPAGAQIEHPRASPSATVWQRIGVSEVTIAYSRPGVIGRKIMGDVIPYGRIWRVGANESTKITFSDSVTIEGHVLAPGTYALYAIPSKAEWTIIIHKNTTHWGDGRTHYNPAEDALRFTVTPEIVPYFTETFTIEVSNITHQRATLVWRWENTVIQFSLSFDTRKKMMHEIATKIKGNPTAATYYESARYLQEESAFPERAREYLMKAHQLAGDKYYIHRVWALVEAQMGNFEEAIVHATRSKELAASEGKDEFVRMNEKSISEWSAKLKDKG
jgi:hypothetical protein